MSDAPIDLAAKRAERERKAGVAAFTRGEAFAFRAFDPDEMAVGIVPGDRPIVLLTDPDRLTGLALTRAEAFDLASDLIDAATETMRDRDGA